ncbi:unnamed protein product [Nezara viridula]|uniref:Uncharacterized protein n=1 Tax=Nezara viridula TaxID=85310 RepID=A0A9P0H1M7_NEZVI|nr:unnamed protein product [Nezara viridula]
MTYDDPMKGKLILLLRFLYISSYEKIHLND